MDMLCKVCGSKLDKKHPWTSHKIKLVDYFLKYYNKRDLLTGDILPFKGDIETYLFNDFVNKNNLKSWLKRQGEQKQKEYLKELLVKRKELKGLSKQLSQFESRDLMMPAISYYIKTFGNTYAELCQVLGLQIIYNYNQALEFGDIGDFIVNIDTRESKPLQFNGEVNISTLNVGDYSCDKSIQKIVVERKSAADWSGTVSKGYDRFIREILRAKEQGIYLVMVIDSSYGDLQAINYLPHTKYIKANKEFLFKRTRDLFANYDNFQAVAVDGRDKASQLIEKLFCLKTPIQSVDLQYFVDIEALGA
jgi:hypothetical protein